MWIITLFNLSSSDNISLTLRQLKGTNKNTKKDQVMG